MAGPYDSLQKIFHEPSRLNIVSELSSVVGELSFVELKQRCALTDGNLSRHLSALEKAGIVEIRKQFVDSKPKTTVVLSRTGRSSFLRYLQALEDVLDHAASKLRPEPARRRLRRKPATESG